MLNICGTYAAHLCDIWRAFVGHLRVRLRGLGEAFACISPRASGSADFVYQSSGVLDEGRLLVSSFMPGCLLQLKVHSML